MRAIVVDEVAEAPLHELARAGRLRDVRLARVVTYQAKDPDSQALFVSVVDEAAAAWPSIQPTRAVADHPRHVSPMS